MQYIDETLAELQKTRQRFDSICVAYSGGKDSLAVLDLCVRTFERVEIFIMEFVPGLSLVESAIEFARKRWGLECRRYLHWAAVQAMAAGVYCDTHWTTDIPKINENDVFNQVRHDTGIPIIATGYKRADSMSRRQMMSFTKNDALIWPIAGWHKKHVIAYCKLRDIPLPKTAKMAMTGVDLKVASLCWLYDLHPEDFQKVLKYFPYAESVIWRRKFYGIGPAPLTKVEDDDGEET